MAIHAYRSEIFWDEGAGHLRFAESERTAGTFTQASFVSMPNLSGHRCLVTREDGR